MIESLAIDGTFDIETEDWDKFVLGGILAPSGFEAFKWDEEDDYIDFLLSLKGTYWGFNMGRFDGLHFLDHLRKRGLLDITCFCAGQRITYIEIGDLILRDAAAIAGPMNLRQFTQIGTYQKSATGLPCICGECEDKENGYCRIKRGMPREELDKLTAYLYDDCGSLKNALETLVGFAEAQGFVLKGTIGASAFATIQKWTQIKDAEWKRSKNLAQYRQVRAGYYGGRTQLFQPKTEHGYRYDINSAYPAALAALELPHGKMSRVNGAVAGRVFGSGRQGIYYATVRVPEGMFIPPLPYRMTNRVAYPVGTFEGAWTRYELDYALSQGVTIEKFGDAFTWHESVPILRSFCERVWKLRDEAGPKSGLGRWLKNFGNSASGKFAQRADVDEILLGPSEIQDECEPAYRSCPGGAACLRHEPKGCCQHTCWRRCGVMLPVGGSRWVYSRKIVRMPSAGYIHWAAYLTAHARVELHRQLTGDGQDGKTAIYCDTDSCYATKPRERNISSHQLGWWKYEGELENWIGLAPKTYGYYAAEHPSGRSAGDPTGAQAGLVLHARSKGIPLGTDHNQALRRETWDRLRSGKAVVINRGVLSLRTAAKNGSLFAKKGLSRMIHADGIHFGDRTLGDDGRTYPPSLVENI